MWQAFPNNDNPKLWISSKSSLKSAFALYNPYSTKAKLLKCVISALPDIFGNVLLKPVTLNEALEDFKQYKKNIDNILNIDSTINISPGTKSKHQKTTVQIISNGVTEAFLKISKTPQTIELSTTENNVLIFLENKNLSFQKPKSLFGGIVKTSYYLIQSAPVYGFSQSKAQFGKPHQHAILDLYHLGSENINLSTYISTIRNKKNTDNLAPYIYDIEKTHGNCNLKLCFSHGDFSPWNILVNKTNQLFIFDWEHGDKARPLLFDFLHYHYMTCKLLTNTAPKTISNYLTDLFYSSKNNMIFKHMNITFEDYNLYSKLYMIQILLREINENNQPSLSSIETLKNL